MDNFDLFVPNVYFEKIPIKNLVSNQDYQRSLSQAHIDKAAANFDIFQVNPVKVSRRNGVNYVFNGQHTIEIVAKVSGSRETPVWCMIYDELNYEHEADIFANQMKYVKALLPYEVFMANIEAGNEQQLMIKELVESFGLKIHPTKIPGGICAVSTLENIYEKYGYHVLHQVLRLIIATWEGDNASFNSIVMTAVAKICVACKSRLDERLFIDKVGTVSLKSLIRVGKDRRAGSTGLAEAMLMEYNKKKGTVGRISLRLLYDKDVSRWVEEDDDDYIDDFDYSGIPSNLHDEDIEYDDNDGTEEDNY